MQPDKGIIVPRHALVHAQNQIAVGIEALVPLGFGTGIAHIAEALADQVGADKGHALQLEGFSGIRVDAITALLGLFALDCRFDKARMAHQPVDTAGFFGIGVGLWIHGHTIGTRCFACNVRQGVYMNRWMNRAMIALLACAAWGTAMLPAEAAVQGREIAYQVDGKNFTGYLAYDDALAGERPGVLVLHEWWGHNAYARHRAEMLAGLGYTAFALDMYGSGKLADHPDDATKFMQAATADAEGLKKRFMAALKILQDQEDVNPEQVAAIGYCMGGGIALNMARAGMPLKGVAVFHGSLGTKQPVQAGQIKGEIAVFTGAADPFVPAEQVQAFEQEMQAAGVRFTLKSYPGAKHSFTNPDADGFAERFGMPLAYDKAADADSWRRLTDFLHRIFSSKEL